MCPSNPHPVLRAFIAPHSCRAAHLLPCPSLPLPAPSTPRPPYPHQMENWGLLTYRETALLVDERAQDIQQEFYIALVVSHEVGTGRGSRVALAVKCMAQVVGAAGPRAGDVWAQNGSCSSVLGGETGADKGQAEQRSRKAAACRL